MMASERTTAVADALRRKHAEQRGIDTTKFLPFGTLTRPEQVAWEEMAVAASGAWTDYDREHRTVVDPTALSTREVEAIVGVKLSAKVEVASRGERSFHRVGSGWLEYPTYPEVADAGA